MKAIAVTLRKGDSVILSKSTNNLTNNLHDLVSQLKSVQADLNGFLTDLINSNGVDHVAAEDGCEDDDESDDESNISKENGPKRLPQYSQTPTKKKKLH